MTDLEHCNFCNSLLGVVKSSKSSIRRAHELNKGYYAGKLSCALLSLNLYKIWSGKKIFSKPRGEK